MLRARHVTGPLHRLRGLLVSNVFLLDGGPGDRWIVDTGHPVERLTLVAGLRATGLGPGDVTGALLTHRHSDHAGNAAFLRRAFGIAIYAHRADAELLEGHRDPPRLRPVTGDPVAWAFAQIENRTRVRTPVDHALEEGDVIGSLEVHHAPGHTEGSALYRHAGTKSLLSGDALLAAVPPLTIAQRMCLPHPDYAVDLALALSSLERFHARDLPYENLLAGHGDPILGGARDRAIALVGGALDRAAAGGLGERSRPRAPL
jgi:glyoxylase-like metal-dependent hydrolase (beta-lactamase superfamily II)